MIDSAKMYLEYESKMQRSGLFQLLSENFSISKIMYPGSYIHISPSFYFPEVVYVDTDSKAKKFFNDTSYHKLVSERRIYSGEFKIRFHALDYREVLPEKQDHFDLLISQYAGFVSIHCKKYLKPDGFLIVNNSHGDAGVAFLDPDFSLIAVINYRNDRFYLSTKNLNDYFVPKKQDIKVSLEYLLDQKRGLGYVKTASHYVFRKEKM